MAGLGIQDARVANVGPVEEVEQVDEGGEGDDGKVLFEEEAAFLGGGVVNRGDELDGLGGLVVR